MRKARGTTSTGSGTARGFLSAPPKALPVPHEKNAIAYGVFIVLLRYRSGEMEGVVDYDVYMRGASGELKRISKCVCVFSSGEEIQEMGRDIL